MLLTSGSSMTLGTGQVKVKVFGDSEYLVLSRTTEPHQMEISQYNDMDRVWDISRYHPKLLVSTEHIQDQGHSRSRGQAKVKLKTLGLAGVIRGVATKF